MSCLESLPHDILLLIFTQLKIDVREIDPYHRNLDPAGGLWALSLVSRGLNSLVTPFLAHNLWCDNARWPSLCRFLFAHQDLRPYAKQLQIDILGDHLPPLDMRNRKSDQLSNAESSVILAVVRDLTSIEDSRKGELTESTSNSFAAFLLHWLPNLELVCLIRGTTVNDYPIPSALEASCKPGATILTKLRNLFLGPPLVDPRGRPSDYFNRVHFNDGNVLGNMLRHPGLRILDCNCIQPELYYPDILPRMSQVEELYLRNLIIDPPALECIVYACTALTVLQVDELYWDPDTLYLYDRSILNCLERHYATLEEVSLYFAGMRWSDVAISRVFLRFHKLKCLYLGASETQYHATDADDDSGESESDRLARELDWFLPTLEYLCLEPCASPKHLIQMNRELPPQYGRYKPRTKLEWDIPADKPGRMLGPGNLYSMAITPASPKALSSFTQNWW